MGMSGSEGGPEKRAGSNPGTALRLDPYFRIQWKRKRGTDKVTIRKSCDLAGMLGCGVAVAGR
jgi:hypothetical protein